jgi:hypothetical protein
MSTWSRGGPTQRIEWSPREPVLGLTASSLPPELCEDMKFSLGTWGISSECSEPCLVLKHSLEWWQELQQLLLGLLVKRPCSGKAMRTSTTSQCDSISGTESAHTSCRVWWWRSQNTPHPPSRPFLSVPPAVNLTEACPILSLCCCCCCCLEGSCAHCSFVFIRAKNSSYSQVRRRVHCFHSLTKFFTKCELLQG